MRALIIVLLTLLGSVLLQVGLTLLFLRTGNPAYPYQLATIVMWAYPLFPCSALLVGLFILLWNRPVAIGLLLSVPVGLLAVLSFFEIPEWL